MKGLERAVSLTNSVRGFEQKFCKFAKPNCWATSELGFVAIVNISLMTIGITTASRDIIPYLVLYVIYNPICATFG